MESGNVVHGEDVAALAEALNWTNGPVSTPEDATKFARQAAKFLGFTKNSAAIHDFREGLETLQMEGLIRRYPSKLSTYHVRSLVSVIVLTDV